MALTAVGLNLVQSYLILLNPELNFRSGSAKVLNFELNFSLVLKGSGLNFGSGPNFSNTSQFRHNCQVQQLNQVSKFNDLSNSDRYQV